MRRDWGREQFCVRTDAMTVGDKRLDVLYDIGLGGASHVANSPGGNRTVLFFDFADINHPQPVDELGAECIVRPAMERLGLTVYGWWVESEDES